MRAWTHECDRQGRSIAPALTPRPLDGGARWLHACRPQVVCHALAANLEPLARRASPMALSVYSLVPGIGVLREAGTLHPYDAEALAGRRLHHHPAVQAIYQLGAQLAQARHFGRDVISLDV